MEPTTVVLMPMPLHPGLGHDIFLEALASIKEENIFAVTLGPANACGLSRD